MIIIIGAGLSGLLTGYLLKKESIPFKILEARNRVGGRINSIYRKKEAPVEMGATWFTDQHTNLVNLLEELKIEQFQQFMEERIFYQPNATTPPQIVQIPGDGLSYRISGGSYHLINCLAQNLDSEDILLNQNVKHINFKEKSVEIKTQEIFEASSVVLAIPPKLWVNNISFEPEFSKDLLNVAMQTHTWMEDSIKVALTFKEPFWLQENLPATLFSNAGPVTEFYDHCNQVRTEYALCGFVNSAFKNIPYLERKELVIHQLKNIFGTSLTEYLHYEECVWADQEQTFQASETPLLPHQNNGHPIFRNTYFNNRLFISGSETASAFPGYMEGAVIAAMETVKKIKKEYSDI